MKNILYTTSQRGSILVFSLLIMSVIISITFAVLGIFLPKLKIAADPLKSAVALYAADSGIEWCLYINRGKPSPPLLPVIGNTGATVAVYYPANQFTQATCDPAVEITLNHRSVGTYQGVARSLEIIGSGIVLDNPTSIMLSQSGLTGFTAANIIDGNTATNGWNTDTSSPGAWLKIDLGVGNSKAYVQTRIYASAAAYAGNYTIQYSDDDFSWLDAVTGFVPSSSGWNLIAWPNVGGHRYWRFNLTNAPGAGAWLNELEMYR